MTTANAYPTTQTIHTIGILGGGQLGMMLAEAAMPLGYQCVFLEDSTDCPASLYGRVFTSEQLEEFIAAADVFTLEFENTPTATVERLAELSKTKQKQGMFPPLIALDVAQDRLKEKQLFNELDIVTVPFVSVSSLADLQQASQTLGLPIVLKTSRGGYDGKGQYIIREHSDIKLAWQALEDAVSGKGNLTSTPAPLIAEGFINFNREVSIIAARAQDGSVRCYDLVENYHYQGILAKTQAPAVGTSHLFTKAQKTMTILMNHLDYVGVMALELFVSKDEQGYDQLLANEIAPRVHNSGHWSIEGAITSQFENHIRAVVGLPLGDTDNIHPAIMVNVLGSYPELKSVLAIDGAHYHSYHKAERPERKIAHVTLMPNDVADLEPALAKLVTSLPNKVGLGKKVTLPANTDSHNDADANISTEAVANKNTSKSEVNPVKAAAKKADSAKPVKDSPETSTKSTTEKAKK